MLFMPPWSKIGGHIVFVLSVILSLPFCHSVILSFCPPLWNYNLAYNFWTVSARALIFHMSIPCEKIFPWVPLFLTLWPWLWSLTFLKTLNLTYNFWTVKLELWYFTWEFLKIRPSRGYQCVFSLWPWSFQLRPFRGYH